MVSESLRSEYQAAEPQLLCQRVEDNTFHLALQRVDRLPGFRKKAPGLAKALGPDETPATGGRAAKRLEIKEGNKVACPGEEVSDSLHRMPDFASFVCFVGQKFPGTGECADRASFL